MKSVLFSCSLLTWLVVGSNVEVTTDAPSLVSPAAVSAAVAVEQQSTELSKVANARRFLLRDALTLASTIPYFAEKFKAIDVSGLDSSAAKLKHTDVESIRHIANEAVISSTSPHVNALIAKLTEGHPVEEARRFILRGIEALRGLPLTAETVLDSDFIKETLIPFSVERNLYRFAFASTELHAVLVLEGKKALTLLSPEAKRKLPTNGSAFKKLMYIFKGFIDSGKSLLISGDAVKLDELIKVIANSDSFNDAEDAKMKLLKIVEDFDSDDSSLISVLRLVKLFTLHKDAEKPTYLHQITLASLEGNRQILAELNAGLSETVAIVMAAFPAAGHARFAELLESKRESGFDLVYEDSSLRAVVVVQYVAMVLAKGGFVEWNMKLVRKLFGDAKITDEQLKAFFDNIRDAAIAFESKTWLPETLNSSKLFQILLALESHRAKLK